MLKAMRIKNVDKIIKNGQKQTTYPICTNVSCMIADIHAIG